MRFSIMLAALMLAACAPSVDGTELGGVARWNGISPGEAVQAADVHCRKYGRVARTTQISPYAGYVTFSCDRPERS